MGLFRKIVVSKNRKKALVAFKSDKYLDALYLFKKIASDDIIAQYHLGLMYLNGLGTEINKKKAMTMFDNAAERGIPEAQLYLGYMFYYEEGIDNNKDIGAYWVGKAAEKNNFEAKELLKKIQGEKIPEVRPEEIEKLARSGNLNIIMYLADTLYKNHESEEDVRKAIYWYKQAAEKNYAPAYKKMAEIYLLGDGVKKDKSQAIEFLAKANQLINDESASVLTMEFSQEKLTEIWDDIKNNGKNHIYVHNKHTQQRSCVFSCEGDVVRIQKQLYLAFSRNQMMMEIVNYFAEITDVRYIHVYDENQTRVIELKKIR